MTELKKAMTTTDKSTKALVTAATNLGKVAGDLQTLAETSASLVTDIELKQGELQALSATYSDEERKAKAELNIKVLENEEAVLMSLLKKRGLANISTADVKALEDQLAKAKADQTKEISEAVAAEASRLNAKHDAEMTKVDADHSVETATLKAQIDSLGSKVEHLTTSLSTAQTMLDNERIARVETAKASQTVLQVPSAS